MFDRPNIDLTYLCPFYDKHSINVPLYKQQIHVLNAKYTSQTMHLLDAKRKETFTATFSLNMSGLFIIKNCLCFSKISDFFLIYSRYLS